MSIRRAIHNGWWIIYFVYPPPNGLWITDIVYLTPKLTRGLKRTHQHSFLTKRLKILVLVQSIRLLRKGLEIWMLVKWIKPIPNHFLTKLCVLSLLRDYGHRLDICGHFFIPKGTHSQHFTLPFFTQNNVNQEKCWHFYKIIIKMSTLLFFT